MGTTLVELIIVMVVLTLVTGLSAQVTVSIARNMSATASYADSVGRARLALGSMERQVRSGDVLFDPVAEAGLSVSCAAYGGSAGSCMRVYTQVDGVRRCVQWQVVADGATGTALLRTRTFSPSWVVNGDVSDWRTVARGLQPPSASAPPFTLLGGSTAYSSRLLEVNLVTLDASRAGRRTTVTSALAGRNATYGYDTTQCSPGPA